ncbi:putative virulence-associated protein [Treponema primitia ZAS-2]|uniref:Putative virulence-associated protein n=1 Tax=Treponema primitia (strain ATCC BAA-887 / DSM 12427 / ZAS-2) TaxID=545694 RepID=F5YKN6_TREPZ|nr:type II toxin-antitoxin system VapC family toxin [Treponema primitia]AEF86647.1 putative virulence-associated protein [Treponema primitia ZAS-2]
MYMLDTNICIYIIKKKNPNVLKKLKSRWKKGLAISTITLAELEFGNENSMYKEKNQIALIEFLSIIDIKSFDEKATKEYGIIKKGLKDRQCLIGPLDMLIGAHAKSLGMTLVTNNTKEFERIKNLKVENWV